jgi:DNA-binding NarL/FixJ family response regulator
MADPLPSPIRVIIVDDHRLFNDGLKAMLANQPAIEVVGQVYHSREAPVAVATHRPDVLLMDFNMPGANGLEMTRQLLHHWPALRVLILSMYAEQRYIDDFQKAGARGYILKTTDVDDLVAAIRQVAGGGLYVNPGLGRAAPQNNHTGDLFLKKFRLTPREVEVIGHIRQGLTSQQIAEAMHISFYTVETHRKNIHLKLGVKNTIELLRLIDEQPA